LFQTALPSLEPVESGPAMGESISALLVEDDVRLAKLTADYLAGHAVQVLHVEDGESAILETGRKRFDVIVLDVMLTSIECCIQRERERRHRSTPIGNGPAVEPYDGLRH
jgi:CheY-like chemotaxis protein